MNESQIKNKKNKQAAKKKLKAKFLKESFGDKFSVEANKEFVKTWTFKNEGETAWPADTRFVFSNGN